jgi:hypothetical protein
MSIPMRRQDPLDSPLAPDTAHKQRAFRGRKQRRQAGSRTALFWILLTLAIGAAALGASRKLQSHSVSLRFVQEGGVNSSVSPVSVSADRRLGFISITGSVRNLTSHPLNRVEAVVEMVDDRDRPIGLESALIAFDPLKGGQCAPFRVDMQDNPHAVAYHLHFRSLLGPLLN